MTTLVHLERQIAALQKKAEEIRRKEVDEVVAKIKTAIAAYKLTPTDLFTDKTRKAVRRPDRPPRIAQAPRFKPNKGKSPPKYHDGNGNAWGGMGKRPSWFKAAIAAGRSPESMLVSALH